MIYSLRTRTYLRKVSRSLFYLWTYSTFRVSFRRQTTFKFSSLPEHTQRKNLTVATNACRVTEDTDGGQTGNELLVLTHAQISAYREELCDFATYIHEY